MIFHKIKIYSDSGWYLLVRDLDSYTAVLLWRGRDLAKGYVEGVPFLKHGMGHPETKQGQAVMFFLQAELENRETELSMVDAITLLSEQFSSARDFFYERDGGFYINQNGGVREIQLSQHESIVAEVKRTDLIFPTDDKIEIKKWRGGRHWYAKKGGMDIVIAGKQKWNTRRAAEEAVIKFEEGDKK